MKTKILSILAFGCVLILSGCSKDNEEFGYSTEQKEALSMLNGTYKSGLDVLDGYDILIFNQVFTDNSVIYQGKWWDGDIDEREINGFMTRTVYLTGDSEPRQGDKLAFQIRHNGKDFFTYEMLDANTLDLSSRVEYSFNIISSIQFELINLEYPAQPNIFTKQ